MRKHPLIIIAVETKSRELHSKVLIGSRLAQLGYKVQYIIPAETTTSDILSRSPVFFLDRNIMSFNRERLACLKQHGIRLGCLDEESAIWLRSDFYKNRLDWLTSKITDLFFSWGPKNTEIASTVFPQHKIKTTGNPRFEYIYGQGTRLDIPSSGEPTTAFQPYVLFASNFALVNPFTNQSNSSDVALEKIQQHINKGIIKTDNQERLFLEYINIKRRTHERLLAALRKLAQDFPDKNFIIRPHPSERPDPLTEYFKGLDNCYVLFEGALDQWIYNADVVLQDGCTSALESYLLGVPCIQFTPDDLEGPNDLRLVKAVSHNAGNYDDLKKALAHPENIAPDNPDILAEYIYLDDSEPPSYLIAKYIDNELQKNHGRATKVKDRLIGKAIIGSSYLLKKTKALRRRHASSHRERDGYKKSRREEQKQKNPGITYNEIKRMLDKEKSLGYINKSVHLEEINGHPTLLRR